MKCYYKYNKWCKYGFYCQNQKENLGRNLCKKEGE